MAAGLEAAAVVLLGVEGVPVTVTRVVWVEAAGAALEAPGAKTPPAPPVAAAEVTAGLDTAGALLAAPPAAEVGTAAAEVAPAPAGGVYMPSLLPAEEGAAEGEPPAAEDAGAPAPPEG